MPVSGADVEKIKEGIGYGIPPKNAENFIATGFGGKAQLSWTIGDTEINGQVICTLKGCMIRKKQGSAPQSLEDGTLVATLNREQTMSYSEVPYEDPQSIGTSSDWYYRLFFYSDHDVFNLDERNIVKVRGTSRAKIWGFRQDFNNLNPDSQISYIEDCVGFSPAYHNGVYSDFTNGGWHNWEWFTDIKPHVVSFASGKSIKKLNPLYMNEDLEGVQITSSECNGFENGIFTWIPKIYMKEEYSGNVRVVKFSLTNRDPRTTDFKLPRIFRGKNGEELEGFWMPYSPVGYCRSYVNQSVDYRKLNFRIAAHQGISEKIYAQLDYYNGGSQNDLVGFMNDAMELVGDKGAFLGIDFFGFFRDIFYLMYKSTNQIAKRGMMAYNSSADTMYQAPYKAPMNFKSSTKLNGAFWKDEIAFYSRILTGHINLQICDPYVIGTAREAWYKNYPSGSIERTPLKTNGWYKVEPSLLRNNSTWIRSLKMTNIGLSVPTNGSSGGSSSTGLCANWTFGSSNNTIISWGDYNSSTMVNVGGTNSSINTLNTNGGSLKVFAITIIAPVGYKPI